PPPTITDNISDLERLNRTLDENALTPIRYSHGFVSTMAEILRMSNWDVDINYIESNDGMREAIFLTSKEYCTKRYGLAIDIGTTTIVVYLVNLIEGVVIDTGSTYNSQIRYGDDVITRIVYATEGNGLEELRSTVVDDINSIVNVIRERHNIRRCEIDSVVISANTTMSHLFWGLNPASIREEPYVPTVNKFPLWRASFARLSINPQSPIYTMPCVASYVGGDIVSGVLATKMNRNNEIALFMDIGTNGEIAIGNNEWLMTAACSAGPCFEGSGISSGMRATNGAIEAVSFDKDTLEPTLTVIGNGKPLGICGSGMIDALAGMFLSGIINQKGKFIPERSKRIRQGEEGYEYLFYHDEQSARDIVLTEVDIDNLMRAKAAIYAGISTILNDIGITFNDIQKVYIAGGFGNFIDAQKAVIIGMLPDIDINRYVFMGNTSATGAYLSLLSTDLMKEAEQIANKMTYLELSVSKNFMDDYMSALFLPHTDIKKFPSVEELLKR
ncbi:MAG: ASKHA domain-containing protein, partial [Thermodesulfovibrionales bacterium]|nr:ASKHA domain-containing protein [Thermodesulfovibrionales bacterium]